MSNFKQFADSITARIAALQKLGQLLVLDLDKDALWEHYLNSFPPGTNEMYRNRREYDCGCCRNFIKNAGALFVVQHGLIFTIWDVDSTDPTFAQVSESMRTYVLQQAETSSIDAFYSAERQYGAKVTYEQVANGQPLEWHHFHMTVPEIAHVPGNQVAVSRATFRDAVALRLRALDEYSISGCQDIADLIADNGLYRAEGCKAPMLELIKHLKAVEHMDALARRLYAIEHPFQHFRNTAFGELLLKVSGGTPLEDAVRAYETMVAGANYRRPTAIVTKGQLENAKKALANRMSALQRRFATSTDVPLEHCLFVDRTASTAALPSSNPLDDLLPTGQTINPTTSKAQQISLNDFLAQVVPTAQSIDAALEYRHIKNFMSLVAPEDPTSYGLLAWDNGISWSYNGNFADAVKERVKAAGGKVDSPIAIRLAWHNDDDLDLSVQIRDKGGRLEEIAFHNKIGSGRMQLDVDMNAFGQHDGENPVENIVALDMQRLVGSVISVRVNQYTKRTTARPGFQVDIEVFGEITSLHYPTNTVHGTQVAKIHIESLTTAIVQTAKDAEKSSKQGVTGSLWGVPMLTWVPVALMCHSPNHWAEPGTGLKHTFLFLKDCVNPDGARGFYNEQLHPDLRSHGRAMEMLGNRIAAAPSQAQLSGVGFSQNSNESVLLRVKTSTGHRIYQVTF